MATNLCHHCCKLSDEINRAFTDPDLYPKATHIKDRKKEIKEYETAESVKVGVIRSGGLGKSSSGEICSLCSFLYKIKPPFLPPQEFAEWKGKATLRVSKTKYASGLLNAIDMRFTYIHWRSTQRLGGKTHVLELSCIFLLND